MDILAISFRPFSSRKPEALPTSKKNQARLSFTLTTYIWGPLLGWLGLQAPVYLWENK